ncbi:MAG: alpha/beta hydrolase [Lachnospiraceae bacterium]|nr:alpha/beta hydrolase [Lachnospiraceae bacterium]
MKMQAKPFPGYENHYMSYLQGDSEELKAAKEAQGKDLFGYELPEGMTMEDRVIPGQEEGQEITVRVYTPAGLEGPAPMILEIHGGGWVGGGLDIDNYRCIEIAKRVPAIVVSVNYRLSNAEVCYPKPLMDCYAAYMWMHDHAEELGGDPTKLGMHGTSAGGNLVAGLAMYLRDTRGPKCSLAVLNCAPVHLNFAEMPSYHQYREVAMDHEEYASDAEGTYLGENLTGTLPKYAFPGHAVDLKGLCPHFILAAEYDTLRDSSVRYGVRLLETGVPCEMMVAPRVGHGFTTVHNPYTEMIHDLMAVSFRREFGMKCF